MKTRFLRRNFKFAPFLVALALLAVALSHFFETFHESRVYLVGSKHGMDERSLVRDLATRAGRGELLLGLEGFGRHDEPILSEIFHLSNLPSKPSVVGLENKNALTLGSLLLHYGYIATDLSGASARAKKSLLTSLARDSFFKEVWKGTKLQDLKLAMALEQQAALNPDVEISDFLGELGSSPSEEKKQWLAIYRRLIARIQATSSFEIVDRGLVERFIATPGDPRLQDRMIENVLGDERNRHILRNTRSLIARARKANQDLFLVVGEEHTLSLESELGSEAISIHPVDVQRLVQSP